MTSSTFSSLSWTKTIDPDYVAPKLLIIMVGLPARGKSYIARKLARYLNWLQYESRVFNVGERRRIATHVQRSGEKPVEACVNRHPFSSSAAFFDPTNPDLVSARDRIALETLGELLDWLSRQERSSVGILDATNSTLKRRQALLSHIRRKTGTLNEVLFIESCCFDQEILDRNFRLKLDGPDYRNQGSDEALKDFHQRVVFYEKSYVPLGEAEEQDKMPYLQVIDVGRKINTHLIQGFLSSQVVEYILNFNLSERQIWIFCGGESIDDSVGRIGRRSDLTENGQRYAESLVRFIHKERQCWAQNRQDHRTQNHDSTNFSVGDPTKKRDALGSQTGKDAPPLLDFCIWTSTMPQAIQTASGFCDELFAKSQMKALDDLNAGDMAGLTFEEISRLQPAVYAARKQYKLQYRWPGLGGECYVDVIHRLRPVILELERRKGHVLLLTHRAVVRVLLSYFLDLRRDDLAEMVVPKNWGFSLEPVCISL
jgi:6-phosphofructo-2-kinase